MKLKRSLALLLAAALLLGNGPFRVRAEEPASAAGETGVIRTGEPERKINGNTSSSVLEKTSSPEPVETDPADPSEEPSNPDPSEESTETEPTDSSEESARPESAEPLEVPSRTEPTVSFKEPSPARPGETAPEEPAQTEQVESSQPEETVSAEAPETEPAEILQPEETEASREELEAEILLDPEEPAPDIREIPVSQDLPDSGELFAAYSQKAFCPADISTFGTFWRDQLPPQSQQIYDFLKEDLRQVADGVQTYTCFTYGIKIMARELGLSQMWYVDNQNYLRPVPELEQFISENYVLPDLLDAVLTDLPYELYWFDKTNTPQNPGGCWGGVNPTADRDPGTGHYGGWNPQDPASEYVVIVVSLNFSVSRDYMDPAKPLEGPNHKTDRPVYTLASKTGAARKAAENAGAEVERVASLGLSDVEKLRAYSDYICRETSYDFNAMGGNVSYGDPWQMIYVFDGLPETQVVCEGYSKAFQYLCDLTTFDDPSILCHQQSGINMGYSGGGAHMWNVVSFGNINLLVDVTNSDSGMAGQNGGLFLTCADPAAGGYQVQLSGNLLKYTAFDTDPRGLLPVADRSKMLHSAALMLPDPVTGETPVTRLNGKGWVCEINWQPAPVNGVFAPGVAYTAGITLIPSEAPFGEDLTVTVGERSMQAGYGPGLRRTCQAEYPRTKEASRIISNSISLGDRISLRFQVKPGTDLDENRDYVSFRQEGREEVKIYFKDAEKRPDGNYQVVYPVSAKEMTDPVLVQVWENGVGGKVYDRSVKKYADQLLQYYAGRQDGANVKEMLRSMLNYGAEAQKFFHYHEERLANEGLTDTAIRADQSVFAAYRPAVPGGVTGLTYYAGSLDLKSATQIHHYFKLAAGSKMEDYTFHLLDDRGGSELLTPRKTGDSCCVDITQVNAAYLSGSFTLRITCIKDGTRTDFSYSPYSYGWSMVRNPGVRNLLLSMADYHEAAKAMVAPEK